MRSNEISDAAMAKYGVEIFRFLRDRDISLFLSLRDPERSLSNPRLALLLLGASARTRQRVLRALDAYRRPVIEKLLDEFQANRREHAESPEAKEALGLLTRGLAYESAYGRIAPPVFPGPRATDPSETVIDARPWEVAPPPPPASPRKGLLRLLKRAPEEKAETPTPRQPEDKTDAPRFDYLTATPDQCIGFWVGLHKKMREAGTGPLAAVADRLDPFSHSLVVLTLERHDADTSRARARQILEDERARMQAYYRRTSVFFSVFEASAPVETSTLLERLAAASPGLNAPAPPALDAHAPLPSVHPRMEPIRHVLTLARMYMLAKEKGLIALEDYALQPASACPVMTCGLGVLTCVSDSDLLREAVRLKTETMLADWTRRADMVIAALSLRAMDSFFFTAFTLMEARLVQCRDWRDYLG
ncbi:hypothetical protein JCM15519_31640 [Fundidesulfovibrio butyratiphilus]